MKKDSAKNGLWKLLFNKGRISERFRNCNIAIFTLAFILMIIAMSLLFQNIINRVSAEYASYYAASSSDALSAHINREISLMAKAAHSAAVIDWFLDENNERKKILAYEEMSEILGELYTDNLYIGFEKSLREYTVNKDYKDDNIQSFDTLDTNNPEDSWYFECSSSDKDYILAIGIDHVLQKKRVWLDYKVIHNGTLLGIICTGLDFAHITGELFANYNNIMRGFIVDANGIINMDSHLLNNDDFLRYDFETKIEDEFTDSVLLTAVKSHLDKIEDYYDVINNPTVVKLPRGRYRYATIAPIRFTNWSAVILYDSSSPLNMSLFLPVFIIMCVLLTAFSLITSTISRRLIFLPLERLVNSLTFLKDNQNEPIYGLERNDEFGNLANTIQDLFTKANRDALTGLYNRRFMDSSFRKAMDFLSRSNGLLSVIMIDVDYFKKYNDTYGHEQGDVCLKMVAGALAGSVTRINDFVARYGGEEFIVFLPNTDEAGARIIAKNLLKNVQDLKIPHASSTVAPYVTVSIGVTTGAVIYPQTWEDYIKRADESLYMSKQNGRNQYTYSTFKAV